jgi:hypothetical protein
MNGDVSMLKNTSTILQQAFTQRRIQRVVDHVAAHAAQKRLRRPAGPCVAMASSITSRRFARTAGGLVSPDGKIGSWKTAPRTTTGWCSARSATMAAAALVPSTIARSRWSPPSSAAASSACSSIVVALHPGARGFESCLAGRTRRRVLRCQDVGHSRPMARVVAGRSRDEQNRRPVPPALIVERRSVDVDQAHRDYFPGLSGGLAAVAMRAGAANLTRPASSVYWARTVRASVSSRS